MCMEYDRELTVDSVFRNEQEKVFYKLTTPSRESPFGDYIHHSVTYNKGETVVSNRVSTSLSYWEELYGTIHAGLHLFCDMEEARVTAEYIKNKYELDCIVVPVLVKREHFVAAGWWSERFYTSCIVATQCTVLE